MNDPRRATTSSRALERASLVVGGILERAAHRGEGQAAWTRLALAGTFLLLWPLATWNELLAGEGTAVASESVAVVGVVWSLAILAWLRRRRITGRAVALSVLVDCVLALMPFAMYALRPPPIYFGITRVAGLAVIYLVIMGASVRMSRSGPVLAAVVIALGLIPILWADQQVSGAKAFNGAPNTLTIYILIASAAVLGWFSAHRTRELALESARQTLASEKARERLGAYVSEEVAAASLALDEIPLGGVRQEASVLFADLRGFTSASEGREPEAVVAELNEYFDAVVTAIRTSGGVVDKYIGDAVMAVFGVPTTRVDDAACAVRAALAMEVALETVNRRRAARDLPPLRHGVGVHRGVLVAGNIGTPERAQYTVIGDTVNVASRLEGQTKELGVSVLISSAAARAAAGAEGVPPLQSLGEVRLKGRAEAIEVFGLA